MGKKVRTNLYIDSDILKEAQELGLNISKTCENALKLAIEQLRPIYRKNQSKNIPEKNLTNHWWDACNLSRGSWSATKYGSPAYYSHTIYNECPLH